MKTNFLLLILLATSSMASCSGCGSNKENVQTNQTVELKPYEVKIKGYLSNVFEVVDGTYQFELKNEMFTKGVMQVKIKSVKKGNSNDYGLQDGNGGPLYLTLCNANGMPLTNFSDIASDYSADELLKDMMGKIGEENWIKFEAFIYGTKILPDEATTFIITSKQQFKDSSTSSSSNDDDISFSGSGDEKWDKLLDDYEKYVDQYLKILAKANKGDMSALSDYPSLLNKAENLETSLNNANVEKSLSVKQINRMNAIHAKMINAALTMDEEKSGSSTNKSKGNKKHTDDDDDDDDDD